MSTRFAAALRERNRFIALYVAMVIGLLSAAAIFVHEARIVVHDGQRDEASFAVLSVANRLRHELETAESGQRGFLLTGDPAYLSVYTQAIDDLDDTVLKLQPLIAADPVSLELVRQIEHAKTAKTSELARTIALAESGNRAAALALVQTNEGRAQMDVLHARLDALLTIWRERHRAATHDQHLRLFAGSIALAAMAAFVCFLLVYTVAVQRRAFAKLRLAAAEVDAAASRDALTGLPNRRGLLTALGVLDARGAPSAGARRGAQAARQAKGALEAVADAVAGVLLGRAEEPRAAAPPAVPLTATGSVTGGAPSRVALLYLDVEGFSRINDALGHRAGDVFLRRLAGALREATREEDMLARVGGDEFVLLASDAGDDTQLRELAARLIARTTQTAQAEYGARVTVGARVGIATWPDRTDSLHRLFDAADAAMHAAKQGGRETWRFSDAPQPGAANVLKWPR